MMRYIRYILPNKRRFSIDRVINTDIRTLTSEPPPIRFRIALLISFHSALGRHRVMCAADLYPDQNVH